MSNALKPALPPVSSPLDISQKRNVNWLRILLATLGLLIATISIVILIIVTVSTSTKTLDAFCSDLKKSDYHAAYSQFSLSYQYKISERNFINQWVSTGAISCTYSSVNVNGNKASAIINYQNVIGIGEIDQATLIKGNDSIWRINALQSQPQNLQA